MSIFVDDDDLVVLTGCRNTRRQIDQLRVMGVPFRINAAGRPVVAIAAIEGGRNAPAAPREKVIPPALRG